MISVKDLFVSFTKEYDALHNINLKIENGEKIALIGDSESGKTTLIRVLASLQVATKGEVCIDQTPISKVNFKQDVALGYVPLVPVFKNKKTAYENMQYILKIRGFDTASMNFKITSALKNFGVDGVRNVPISSLTMCQKQLLQLSRVSMRSLDIVLIDNISKQLLSKEKQQVIDAIKLLIESQPNAIFVVALDSEKLASELGLKVIKLKNGSIVQSKEKTLPVENQ